MIGLHDDIAPVLRQRGAFNDCSLFGHRKRRLLPWRPTNYLALAQQYLEEEAGGRFAKMNAARVTGIPVVPKQPDGSPWSADPAPDEPPTGYRIDDL
jgi:hypothetical protein